jgi:hypothetical protein
MRAQKRGCEPHHFAACNLESGLLEAGKHCADVLLFHAVGFEDDEGFFHVRSHILKLNPMAAKRHKKHKKGTLIFCASCASLQPFVFSFDHFPIHAVMLSL